MLSEVLRSKTAQHLSNPITCLSGLTSMPGNDASAGIPACTQRYDLMPLSAEHLFTGWQVSGLTTSPASPGAHQRAASPGAALPCEGLEQSCCLCRKHGCHDARGQAEPSGGPSLQSAMKHLRLAPVWPPSLTLLCRRLHLAKGLTAGKAPLYPPQLLGSCCLARPVEGAEEIASSAQTAPPGGQGNIQPGLLPVGASR